MSPRTRSFFVTPMVALLALTASVSTTACAHAGRAKELGTPLDADTTVTLVVRNDNFADVDVWVVSYSLPTRLRVVAGNTSQTFPLDPSVTRAPDLRIVATPIGGNGRASSGPVMVQPDQTIDFRIATRLRMSTVSVR